MTDVKLHASKSCYQKIVWIWDIKFTNDEGLPQMFLTCHLFGLTCKCNPKIKSNSQQRTKIEHKNPQNNLANPDYIPWKHQHLHPKHLEIYQYWDNSIHHKQKPKQTNPKISISPKKEKEKHTLAPNYFHKPLNQSKLTVPVLTWHRTRHQPPRSTRRTRMAPISRRC